MSAASLEERIWAWADHDPPSVRFDRFMERALYDPERGYYTAHGPPTGRSGDYYTAAHVHPLFARTLARGVEEEYVRQGAPADFLLVEAGVGDGTLSAGILGALSSRLSSGRRLRYLGVDRSPLARKTAREAIARVPGAGRFEVSFSDSLALEGPFSGLVIANELLDALPCRRFVSRSGGWGEWGVRPGDRGQWEWIERMPADPTPGPPLPPPGEDGATLEISPAAEAWVREVADHLVVGALLILDYGSEEAELLHARPHGTLVAVRGHEVRENALDDPGGADLSAFVDFSRIRAAALESGLRERRFTGQAEALGSWGFTEVRDAALAAAGSPEERVRLQLAAKNLLFGFERFRVLEVESRGEPTSRSGSPAG